VKKIESFQVNHLHLLRGIYVSRKDTIGEETITTFDIRMKEPNRQPVMNTAEIHTIEHLAATFLRNHPTYGSKTVYFGPMGCRTGFYLLLIGDLESKDILDLITEMFHFIAQYEDEIPGASPRDCGNYLDMNLSMARYEAQIFIQEVLKKIQIENLIYPK